MCIQRENCDFVLPEIISRKSVVDLVGSTSTTKRNVDNKQHKLPSIVE